MAQQDYLSKAGGQFGTLAGSILSDRRRRKKKDAITALAISAFVETLGAKNRQLDQELKDSLEEVNFNYANLFEENKELYNLKEEDRNNYRSYLDNKEEYLHNEAVKLFNSNRNLQTELGSLSPYSEVNQEKMDPESYKAAIKVYEAFRRQAEADILERGKNPGVSIATYSEFKKPLMDEYKAALAQVKDDPTKKGALRNWWNKAFGEDKEGNKRFGMVEVAELENNLANARRIRENRDSALQAPRIQDSENAAIDETIAINQKANSIVREESLPTYADSIVPLNYDFKTNAQVLKENKEAFSKKINGLEEDEKGNRIPYKISMDDIIKSIEYNIRIPGFSDLGMLMNDQREELVKIAVKIQSNPDTPLWQEGFLTDNEKRIWSIAINQDIDRMQTSKLELRRSKILLDKAIADATDLKTVTRKELLEVYSKEDDKVIFENTIKNVLEEARYAPIKDIYNNKISEETKNGFRKNVTEGAILLQKYNKGMSYSDALRQSIDLQMGGFYQYREDPSTFYNPMTWGEQPTYRHEYVNMEDLKLLDRSPMATTNYDADRVVDLLNNKKYIQNMKGKDNKPLKPVSSDRSFVDGDYEYFVEAVTPKDIQGNIIKGDDGEPLPPFFMWKYRRLEQ